jgi:hypothetical protein
MSSALMVELLVRQIGKLLLGHRTDDDRAGRHKCRCIAPRSERKQQLGEFPGVADSR